MDKCRPVNAASLPEDRHSLTELRRGVITLAVLLRLRVETHGYAVRQALADFGLPLKEGTLYPLLKRLEEQGVIAGRLDHSGERPRRCYVLTPPGRSFLASLHAQWEQLTAVLEAIDRDAVYRPGRVPRLDAVS